MAEVLYVERISAIEDIPGLYISDITIPRSDVLLREHGITHIISLANQRTRPKIGEELGIQQLHIEIEDNPMEDLLMFLEAVCAWIEDALSSEPSSSTCPSDESEPSGKTAGDNDENLDLETVGRRKPKVLIHCVQGISRSGAIVIAYLMQARSLDYELAFASARASRAIIGPNSGFADQLRLWQQMGYSIFAADQDEDGNAERETKPEYEEWRLNRGVLLSKREEEKQRAARKRMADMVAGFKK